jgi:[protein-PII] uridylyltransferase
MIDIVGGFLPSPLSAAVGKKALLQGREILRRQYSQNANSAALLRDYCRLVDGLLRQVWKEMSFPSSIALLAVGGYGRGHLFPGSDIDRKSVV